MPIYEYACEQCGHEFEALQKMSDEPLKTCPACSADALKKKVSAAAFRLKGGGWYETDFKSGKKKNLVDGDKSSDSNKKADESKPKKESSSSSETKPKAAKSEPAKKSD